jgi:hypothetical protein
MGLLAIKDKAIDAEFHLRITGNASDADRVGLGIDRLDVLIRVLRAKMLDDWSAQVPGLRKKLGKMNADAQLAIDDIRDDVETAQRVVALIGKVDKLVSLLSPIIL